MDFDLSDPTLLLRDEVIADPRPLYDTLRRRAPVWRLPGQNSYLVADPTLIREAVSRPEEFSSNLVSLLHRDADGYPVATLPPGILMAARRVREQTFRRTSRRPPRRRCLRRACRATRRRPRRCARRGQARRGTAPTPRH